VVTNVYAQQVGSPQTVALAERVEPAPESVFSKFCEAGMQPVNHVLTETEKKKGKQSICCPTTVCRSYLPAF